MPTATLKINHVGISVPDLDAAVAWYTEHLGFRQLKPNVLHKRDESIDRNKDKNFFRIHPEPVREVKVAYLAAGNGIGFELFEFLDPKHQVSPGFGPDMFTRTGCYHIAVTTEDPVALCEKLVGVGATQIGDPARLANGDVVLYLRDPCGVILELCS
ncbi:Glyoxalase/Bleomycin resistance protein/Dihydroxybiphenyl dioxygenase [Exophiala viscosa]|uniref:Glyoxalase/Bleomycin resistance protein/Dihydroxybiphenyl dioxygenase n=1 Tax=Exophiala viscosa TaxID=2486360 RepID=A0AAN6DPN0_9EURO|nr:Glyoxalase/Bleomycin resistance protein/Dihydroxybiphenyl dioxygenase [Exophiala viscosa]KAI1620891.1 Glyoxalase/Bleomycin resistance protein/Dihydroxybiphenyl dioxygenase [Exophiala viscosa]